MGSEAFNVPSRLSFALCFVDKLDFRKALQSPPVSVKVPIYSELSCVSFLDCVVQR